MNVPALEPEGFAPEKVSAPELVRNEIHAVGSDSEMALARGPLAVGQIVLELPLRVRTFALEIGFELEDRSAEQRVETAVHFRQGLLEINISRRGAEVVDQEAMDFASYLLVAWPGNQLRDHLAQLRFG